MILNNSTVVYQGLISNFTPCKFHYVHLFFLHRLEFQTEHDHVWALAYLGGSKSTVFHLNLELKLLQYSENQDNFLQ